MRRLAALLVATIACGCGATARAPGDSGSVGGEPDLALSTACNGLHCAIANCDNGADTIVTGRVFAPNGLDPVPGAVVWVPDLGLPEFPVGASCDLCSDVSGAAAVAHTSAGGSFTLAHVPSGTAIPIVVQLGHFRRALTLDVAPCVTQALPKDAGVSGVRLPHRDGELDPGDAVPHIAIATGDYDQIECVLHRMGLEQFDLYDDRGGVDVPQAIAPLQALLSDGKKLLGYNLLVVNCTNNEFEPLLGDAAVKANLAGFVGAGGRLYVTDWAYDTIEQVPEFAPFLCFEPQNGDSLTCGPGPQPAADADTTNDYSTAATVKDAGLARWLAQFPGVIGNGAVQVSYSFVSIAAVSADAHYPTKTWLTGQTPFGVKPMTVTFDYNGCGRVHYSTYNTEPNGVVPDAQRYPNCRPDSSPQERILEYLMFEIAACVGPIPG